MKNHTEILLATPSMCQSRDLLIHVLYRKNRVEKGHCNFELVHM